MLYITEFSNIIPFMPESDRITKTRLLAKIRVIHDDPEAGTETHCRGYSVRELQWYCLQQDEKGTCRINNAKCEPGSDNCDPRTTRRCRCFGKRGTPELYEE